jgi:hypothetical protein
MDESGLKSGALRVALRTIVTAPCRPEYAVLSKSRASITYVLSLCPIAANLQRKAVLASLGQQLGCGTAFRGKVSARRRGKRHRVQHASNAK